MISPAEFDQRHGKNAFGRLRLLLADPQHTYQTIGKRFGLTRHRVAQLALGLGIDVQERRRKRGAARQPVLRNEGYPAQVAAVIAKIRLTARLSRTLHVKNIPTTCTGCLKKG